MFIVKLIFAFIRLIVLICNSICETSIVVKIITGIML
jgi:hypothetical protein